MGKTSSLNWYIYRMCSFDYLSDRVKKLREDGKLSKAEREKLLDEIARKLKELGTRKKELALPEEALKYIEEAKETYPELLQ